MGASGSAGWSKWGTHSTTFSTSAGSMAVNADATAAAGIYKSITTVEGRRYRIVFDIDGISGSEVITAQALNTSNGSVIEYATANQNGHYVFEFIAVSTTSALRMNATAGAVYTFDNVKCINVTDEPKGSSYRFGFNGQEKDDEVDGLGNTMSAEFWEYDARLGRRWNCDPAFREKPWASVYQTFSNNPILYVDPDGDVESPIVDKNGNLLGTDDQGMSGDVIVADDPSKFKQGMKHDDAKKLGSNFSVDRKDMTMEAKIKAISSILEGTVLPNGEKMKQSQFNLTLTKDPSAIGEYLDQDQKTLKHNINLSLREGQWTVENIRIVGGVHEFYEHGVMGWGDKFLGTHNKVYEAEMDSKY